MQRTRRIFMRDAGIAMFGLGCAPAWLARASAAESTGARKKVLVAIFQRGAVDGLNVVVPFGDRRYYELRPTIAIPAPNGSMEAGHRSKWVLRPPSGAGAFEANLRC